MVVPPPGSKSHNIPSIPITETATGLSNREIAVAVIADKLGISEKDVTDDTDLGDAWHEIAMNLAIKTNQIMVSNAGMKASGIFSQI